MTNEERLDYLVKMGMDAAKRAMAEEPSFFEIHRLDFETNMRERMAKVVSVWAIEVWEAQGLPPPEGGWQ